MRRTKEKIVSGSKRSEGDRLYDMPFISQLYIQGLSHREIAERLSAQRPYTIDFREVADDIIRIREKWIERATSNWEIKMAEELLRIDRVEAAAWDGWTKSQGKTQKSVKDMRKGEDKKDYTHVSIQEWEQAGDPRFLAIIDNCIDRRCKLVGLYAPIQVEGNVIVQQGNTLSDMVSNALKRKQTIEAQASSVPEAMQ